MTSKERISIYAALTRLTSEEMTFEQLRDIKLIGEILGTDCLGIKSILEKDQTDHAKADELRTALESISDAPKYFKNKEIGGFFETAIVNAIDEIDTQIEELERQSPKEDIEDRDEAAEQAFNQATGRYAL